MSDRRTGSKAGTIRYDGGFTSDPQPKEKEVQPWNMYTNCPPLDFIWPCFQPKNRNVSLRESNRFHNFFVELWPKPTLHLTWRLWPFLTSDAAKEDIIQCLIIQSGFGESCICGLLGLEGDGGGQTSGVTLCTNEWTMVIHQSSMSACLTAWIQLQCPSQSNLIPSTHSFISLPSFAI